MTAHDPLRVRMNELDGTWHCSVHGLLSSEDVQVTLSRAGLYQENIDSAVSNPILSWPIVRTFITMMELVLSKTRLLRCEPIS